LAYDPYASASARLSRYAETTRRQFLLLIGAIGGLGALLFGGVMSLKFMVPGATNEAPAEFKVAVDPNSLRPGDVHQDTSHRVSLVLDDQGFYAVYLVCTHLGCTPNYQSQVAADLSTAIQDEAKHRGARKSLGADAPANGWACPCHGSRYYIDSTHFYGPAPRPMDWVQVKYAKDGSLLVDRSSIVVYRTAGVNTPPTWRLVPKSPPPGKVVGSTIP
jgi:cytochrome b6-f complex iron-sulfur subunit